jgi:hypothetical protein
MTYAASMTLDSINVNIDIHRNKRGFMEYADGTVAGGGQSGLAATHAVRR